MVFLWLLSKDGAKIASVDASADYNGYGIPKSITADIYAKPLTVKASLTQTSASKYSAQIAITDETSADNNLSVSAEATLSNAINNYTDFDDCEFNNLKFTVTQSNLTVEGSVDIKTLNKVNNPTASDINNCLSATVFHKGKIAGSLRVEEIGKEKYLFIVYKDTTKENTNVYYDSFITDVEDMFKN